MVSLESRPRIGRAQQSGSRISKAMLQKAGFSDEGIRNISLITSYFNVAYRLAVRLGVEAMKKEEKGANSGILRRVRRSLPF